MVVEFINEHKAAVFITIAVVIIIEAIVMFFVARKYRKKLNINAYNGGIVDFIGISLIAFGSLCVVEDNMLGIPMILVGVMLLCFMYYRNFVKFGKREGVILSVIQTVLCIGCLFEMAELSAFKKGQYNQHDPNYYQQTQDTNKENINK